MRRFSRGFARIQSIGLVLAAALTAAAGAACWVQAPSVSCCSTVSTFDGVGNCSPWAHSCPDVATTNPVIQQVMQVGQNQGGQALKSTTSLTCTYQPKKCKFIGCANDGPIATGGCADEVPTGAACPSGGGLD